MTPSARPLRPLLGARPARLALAAPIAHAPAQRADQAQAGAELEIPGPAGDVLPGRGPAATSKPRGSRSRSTRATARRTPIPLVANGTYDVGFGDINALIELAAKKPEDAPIAVYVMFNQPPFTVAVKADSPIKSPKDFEGKTLGGAANDGALKLFPAFVQARQDRLQQGQHHQHAAEPARADADARTGRRRVRLRQHHPFLRQADGRRRQATALHQLRRLRHG